MRLVRLDRRRNQRQPHGTDPQVRRPKVSRNQQYRLRRLLRRLTGGYSHEYLRGQWRLALRGYHRIRAGRDVDVIREPGLTIIVWGGREETTALGRFVNALRRSGFAA